MISDLAPRVLWLDLRLSLGLFTRIPTAPAGQVPQEAFSRSLRLAPVAGTLVGLVVATAFTLASAASLPALAAALVAVGAGLIVTGALHEDGLADLADGLGGGRTRTDKLAIMRDSRVGTYGALALILSVGLRTACLAAIPAGGLTFAVLITSHGLSRALLPTVMYLLPLARSGGLAAQVGRTGGAAAVTALLIGAALSLVLTGPWTALTAVVGASLAAALVMTLAARHIGGYTGDVLGAVQQVAEVIVLMTLVARL